MALTNTLTSLAILKVNIDQGNDYLDYLRPFIIQVLVDYNPEPIKRSVVRDLINESFGLEIPDRTVEIVLKRISKSLPIRLEKGVYRKTGELPDPRLTSKQAEAERHMSAVIYGLKEFSRGTISPIDDDEDAVTSICAFLSEFDVTCLRAYLQGTAIPIPPEKAESEIVLVAQYVEHVRDTDPERFESFMVLVQGHMLANSLLCPDLRNVSGSFRNVTFYFDTPLLIRRLGAEGRAREDAVRELIDLLINLRGRVAVFSHSREELETVLRRAAEFIDRRDGRGTIVFEARKEGRTKSDLILLAESIDSELKRAGVEVIPTPGYKVEYQIDETAFGKALEDEVYYFNPRAKDYDINSLRSIYVIRGNSVARTIEQTPAVLVTNNAGFARASWEYGLKHDLTKDVSSVITDFTLANIAWLKAPMGGVSVPKTQLLAFSYAALQPSSKLLDKYLREIDRLESEGTITEKAHQLLRASPWVHGELMSLTLGEDSALTEEVVTETLERVSKEITKEETEKFTREQKAHQQTLEALGAEQAAKDKIVKNLFWRCSNRAKALTWMISAAVGGLIALGFLWGLGWRMNAPVVSWVVMGGAGLFALITLANLFLGYTVKQFHMRLEKRFLVWFLRRESRIVGVGLEDVFPLLANKFAVNISLWLQI